MITYVHYWYRAPGSSEDVEIATERWPDKAPQDVLPLIGSVGSPTKATPDDPDEHGDTREFEVLGVLVGPITYWPDSPQATVSNILIVSVADSKRPHD